MPETNDQKILVFMPAYNEKDKIGKAVSSIPRGIVSEILVIDDGSVDTTAQEAGDVGAKVISNKRSEGVGSVIRQAIKYARTNGFSILVVMAGNSKDDGREIPRLTEPIVKDGFDFVQGSRFLNGGVYGAMPVYRILATKFVHPAIFSFFTGRRITDSTNGFRAIRLSIFDDKRINLGQDWLNKYELEPYIFFKAIKLGYKVKEVPVSKVYPPGKVGYTKMRPIIDWWLILKPIFLLGFGLAK
jgi:dolichol-phosphate mannosyltransferase